MLTLLTLVTLLQVNVKPLYAPPGRAKVTQRRELLQPATCAACNPDDGCNLSVVTSMSRVSARLLNDNVLRVLRERVRESLEH